MREAARNPIDLGATDAEPIVVELLPQTRMVGSSLIKGQIDHRTLRTQSAKRPMQAFRAGAGLKDDVGTAVRRAVMPRRLGMLPCLVLFHRREPQRMGLLTPECRRV